MPAARATWVRAPGQRVTSTPQRHHQHVRCAAARGPAPSPALRHGRHARRRPARIHASVSVKLPSSPWRDGSWSSRWRCWRGRPSAPARNPRRTVHAFRRGLAGGMARLDRMVHFDPPAGPDGGAEKAPNSGCPARRPVNQRQAPQCFSCSGNAVDAVPGCPPAPDRRRVAGGTAP